MRVIVDMDGTLAIDHHRRHHVEEHPRNWNAYHDGIYKDEVNHPLAFIIHYLHRVGHEICIWTGRPIRYAAVMEEWLEVNNLAKYFSEIRMRPNSDYRKSEILKKEWVDEVGAENIFMAFEDREKMVKMYVDAGVTCFHVHPVAKNK